MHTSFNIPLIYIVVAVAILILLLRSGRLFSFLGIVALFILRVFGAVIHTIFRIFWHGTGAATAAFVQLNRPRPGAILGPRQNSGAVRVDGDYQDYRGLAHFNELQQLTKGDVALGRYLLPSGKSTQELRIEHELLFSGCAIVGPPGSGKSAGIIKPWIESLLKSGSSVITVDVKGDLFESSQRAAEQAGAKFLYWCAGDPRSHQWNWLEEIQNDRDIEAMVRAVLGKPNPKDSQPHFYERDCRWLRGIINLVISTSESHPVPSDLFRLAADQEQLAQVFTNNASSRNFATGFADLLSMSPDEHSRAVSGLLNALYLFGSTDVANVSNKSDFQMKDIGREPTLLLIGAPLADARRSEVLSAIILSRAFNSVYDRFQFGGQERKCPVFFMIDEAARLKDRIVYEEVLSVVRSAGAGVCLALQDITQLGDVEERTAILASCHTMITLRGCSPETARYLSGRLGERRQSNIVEGTARGLFDPFPRDHTRQVQSTGADVLGQREIMHPPAVCGRWCGVVHIPSISAKPFLIDLERASA